MNNTAEKLGIIYHPDYLIHTQGYHPERKERLEEILNVFEKEKILDKLEMITPEPAAVEDIALVHDLNYIRSVDEACRSDRRNLDMDTYIVPESYRVALLSAGGALTGLRRIMDKNPVKVYALNRPPGHHAEYDRAMGFCLFNNIAIAAEVAKRDYSLKKIAIVDWDVHHGNGTQHTFESDPGVLFISTHQSPAYPGTGNVHETGRGQGEGYTINIPLPPGSGDIEYALFFKEIIIPVIDQFKPELLLISAGQDAYRMDPLAGMQLTFSGYTMMAAELAAAADRWCSGRMLLCLEGGYHLEGQAGAVLHVLNAIGRWGLPVREKGPDLKPADQSLRLLEDVRSTQGRYWKL
ncbi:MAG: histone deacetylase [Bacillota bacterium]|nr:histone deacetylase [Bacillota bacterium]MDW7729146.1 histone deacetylase [Bacillota bacterium]